MNAKELTFRGHEKTVLYACGLCGSLHSPKVYAAREDIADATARDSAEKCCMRTECACGRVTNWVMCGHDAVADRDDDTPQPAPDAAARLVEVETPRALLDVMTERVRQVEVEGFERQYDDAYQSRDLAAAAACYAMIAGAHQREVFSAPPIGWPWAKSWWKPTDPRRDLVKAGALILAEIERLDRAACKAARNKVIPHDPRQPPHRKEAISFSAHEALMIRAALVMPVLDPDEQPTWANMLSKREWEAFVGKINPIK